MPERNDLLVGQIALERGWISPDQFREALEEARRRSTTADTLKAAPWSFGRFAIEKQVGQGGFGAVCKARQRDLDRTVALKFLTSDAPEDARRFLREAQTAAQLSHPHIVPIHEVGEQDGKPFIAMEFIDGVTLNRYRLEPGRALQVMRDAAGAIHHAHEKGIIHRDLKPQNLMMGQDGHVWVMDFGLARPLRGGRR